MKQVGKAMAAAMAACMMLPGEQPPRLATAERELNREAYREAATMVHAHLRTHPRDAAARVLLARAKSGQGDLPGAFAELRQALEADPKNIDALYYLGKVGDLMAHAEFQRLFRLAPDSARVHQLMAESYHARDDSQNEEKEYLAALQSDPHSVTSINALGDLARYRTQFDEAKRYYARALEEDPRSYDALYGLAACQLLSEDYTGAVEWFRKAIMIDPEAVAARVGLGNALLKSGDAEAAAKELQTLLVKNPRARQAYALLVTAYRKLGRAKEAREAFEHYRQLSTEDTEAAAADPDITP